MGANYPSQTRDRLVAIATVVPIFVVVALISTLEKALLAATVFGAVWVAVTERWQNRTRAGFWSLVGFFTIANALTIWVLPVVGPFKAALGISYPLGLAEGFLLYWLLGRLKPNTRKGASAEIRPSPET
jgi:hypothetical protein